MRRLKQSTIWHRNKMIVVGGLIVGSPDDTRKWVLEANLEFARRYVDWPYIQHPTPYPGTPMTKDFRDRGLIINERLEEYDGTTAVVRTEHLSADEVEFLAVAGGALDEAAPHAGRLRPQPTLPVAERAENVRAYLPRKHDPLLPRA